MFSMNSFFAVVFLSYLWSKNSNSLGENLIVNWLLSTFALKAESFVDDWYCLSIKPLKRWNIVFIDLSMTICTAESMLIDMFVCELCDCRYIVSSTIVSRVFDCDSKLTNVCLWLTDCWSSNENLRNLVMKFSNESSRRFFDCSLLINDSVTKFEAADNVLKINIDDDLLWMFRWMISKKKGFELCETIKLEVPFSTESKTDEWLVALKVFCVSKKKSAVCCSKKTDVTADVLKVNTKERTTFDKNRERYFFLIKAVGGVDVLLILEWSESKLFFATFNVSSYFLSSNWKLLICFRSVDLNVSQLFE